VEKIERTVCYKHFMKSQSSETFDDVKDKSGEKVKMKSVF